MGFADLSLVQSETIAQKGPAKENKDQVLDIGLKKMSESRSSLSTNKVLKAVPKGKLFKNIQPISVGV